MTIFNLGYDFIALLIGDMVNTARGALVAEYFGYIVVGITVFLLVKIAIWLISYPINLFKGK